MIPEKRKRGVNPPSPYILYREKRSEIRLTKSILGIRDDLKLPLHAAEVLRRRYLLKDDARNVIETPSELFRRVASHVAQGENNFRSPVTPEEAEEHFFQMMRNLEFMPNSPTLMNAGTSFGQLSACFVIPVEGSGSLFWPERPRGPGRGRLPFLTALRPENHLPVAVTPWLDLEKPACDNYLYDSRALFSEKEVRS